MLTVLVILHLPLSLSALKVHPLPFFALKSTDCILRALLSYDFKIGFSPQETTAGNQVGEMKYPFSPHHLALLWL